MLLASAVVGLSAAAQTAGPAEAAPGDAQALLAAVRDAMPDTPLRLTGELQSKSPAGDIEASWPVEMLLQPESGAFRAEYTIRDAFGAARDRLRVRWSPDGRADFEYARGPDLEPAPIPDLSSPIEGMDFSWSDLSLAFLWWPGGKSVGVEKIKGRASHVLDIPAPTASAAAGSNTYAGVRLWIDPEVHVLLQAEGYDERGERIRRLQVKSFKRVRGLWTILDLDVQSYPSRHKTVLRVRDVEPADGNVQRSTSNAQRSTEEEPTP